MVAVRQVVVNVEWGAAGDNGCLDFYRSQYEKDVDHRSSHVGSFTYVDVMKHHLCVMLRCGLGRPVPFTDLVGPPLQPRWILMML